MKSLRAILKILLSILLVFIFIFFVAAIVLQTNWAQSQLKKRIETSIQKSGQPIQFSSLKISLPFHTHIENLSVLNQETGHAWLQLQGLDMDFDPFALLKKTVSFPNINVRQLNITAPFPKGKEEYTDLNAIFKSLPCAVQVGQLQALVMINQGVHSHTFHTTASGSIVPWKETMLDVDADVTSPLWPSLKGTGHIDGGVKGYTVIGQVLYKENQNPDTHLAASIQAKGELLQWQKLIKSQTLIEPIKGSVFISSTTWDHFKIEKLTPLLKSPLTGRGSFELYSTKSIDIHHFFVYNQQLSFNIQGLYNKSVIDGQLQVQLANLSDFTSSQIPLKGLVTIGVDLQGEWPYLNTSFTIQTPSAKAAYHRLQEAAITGQGKLDFSASPSFQGDIQAHALVDELPFALDCHADLTRRKMVFDHLALQRADSIVNGSITLLQEPSSVAFPYLFEGTLQLKIPDLQPWLSFFPPKIQNMGGSFNAECALYTVLAEPDAYTQGIEASAHIHTFSSGPLYILDAQADGKIDDLFALQKGAVTCEAHEISYHLLALNQVKAGVTFDQNVWPFSFTGKGGSHSSLILNSEGQWIPLERTLVIQSFHGSALKLPYQLQNPFQFTYNSNHFTLTPIDLTCGSTGSLHLSAIGSQEHSELNLVAHALPLELLSLVAPQTTLTGQLNADVHLQGDGRGTKGQGHIQIDQTVVSQFNWASTIPVNGYIDVEFLEEQVRLDIQLNGIGSRPLLASGTIPLRFRIFPFTAYFDRQMPMQGALSWEGKLRELASLLLLQTTPVEGVLRVDFSVSGNLNQPDTRGTLRLQGGHFEGALSGIVLTDIEALAIAHGKELTLQNFTASDSRNGMVTASGNILLKKDQFFPFAVDVTLSQAALLHIDEATATFNGKAHLSGTTKGALLEGEIEIDEANLNIPRQIPQRVPTVDVVYRYPGLETHFAALPVPTYPLQLDLTVDAPKHVFVTGRGLTAEWKGEVKITGSAQNPQVKGNLQLVKGKVNLLGRTFPLTQGTVTFAGRPTKDTSLYVISQFEVRDQKVHYNVRAIVQGPLNAPEISFQSSPSLPQTEILSRILFGSGMSDITPMQGFQLAHAVTTVAGTFSGPSDILGNLQHGLGLDQLTIITSDNTSGSKSAKVQAGKYLSEGVFISVDKNIMGDENNLGIEAKLSNDFRIRVEVNDEEDNTVLLEWKHDY